MGKEDGDINIKSLLECGNTMIVCDTNVYLHIYQYTPGYCDFAFDCLNTLKDYLIVPKTIHLEYLDHYEDSYAAMRDRITGAKDRCDKVVMHAKSTVTSVCEQLSKMGFPDILELEKTLDGTFGKQLEEIEDFFADREAVLGLVAARWDEDLLFKLFEELKAKGRILQQFTHEQLFELCKKGLARYKKQIPPGYEDKDKDGMSKYGDYLWWEEVLRYANDNKKNIILITDDIKKDWCEEDAGETVLRKELIREFKHRSKQEIYYFTSKAFFDKYSLDYDIEKPDVVQYALQMTDDMFFERVKDDVFSDVEEDLLNNAIDYIDTGKSHLGSKDMDEFELVENHFEGAELVGIDDGKAIYEFHYDVILSVIAYEHVGDIEEDGYGYIYTTDYSYHEFSGTISVSVTRDADIYSDFEEEGAGFDPRICKGTLAELKFKSLGEPVYCSECGDLIGYGVDDYYRNGDGDPICDSCMEDNDNGFVCPHCGQKYAEIDRGNSGQFCRFCEDEMDW